MGGREIPIHSSSVPQVQQGGGESPRSRATQESSAPQPPRLLSPFPQDHCFTSRLLDGGLSPSANASQLGGSNPSRPSKFLAAVATDSNDGDEFGPARLSKTTRATSGCRSRKFGRQSAQTAQHAGWLGRCALRNPIPPMQGGNVTMSFTTIFFRDINWRE